jgi:hypothetical protein
VELMQGLKEGIEKDNGTEELSEPVTNHKRKFYI